MCLRTWKEKSFYYEVKAFAGIHAFAEIAFHGFPAAGLRNGGNVGQLANSPGNGYYWSSSPNSSTSVNAGNLNFNSGNINTKNNNNRANGQSVRCVSELTDRKVSFCNSECGKANK